MSVPLFGRLRTSSAVGRTIRAMCNVAVHGSSQETILSCDDTLNVFSIDLRNDGKDSVYQQLVDRRRDPRRHARDGGRRSGDDDPRQAGWPCVALL
jgi:hypothetical protein